MYIYLIPDTKIVLCEFFYFLKINIYNNLI